MSTKVPARSFSLRKRAFWWLIPPMAIILLLNAFWSYKGAMDAANRAYDRSLALSLKGIAESIHATGGSISVDIPYSALDLFEEGVQERVYYAIIGPGGRRLTGYDDLLPPALGKRVAEEPVMVDMRFRQQAIRLGALAKRLYDPELIGGDTVTVLFAETTEARTRLAYNLFIESLRPQLFLIFVALVLIMIVQRSAFRPLLDLRDTIRQRRDEDLTPVSLSNVPNELRPLIDAINFHMSRLAKLLQSRRRFLADAAHQIRTPLTVLGTQAEYGRRQDDPEEMRRTFSSLIDTVRSTRRMTNQMLTLARVEPAHNPMQEFTRLDMAELVHDVAIELAALAFEKNMDLSFDGPGTPIPINGNATMLREMVLNLVDNALRYTQEGGHVTLGIALADNGISLRINDDGPGIPEPEREKVFQRFYRILGHSNSEGSGLGLAIVREICWLHGGKIALGEGDDGRGLSVEIRLPVAG